MLLAPLATLTSLAGLCLAAPAPADRPLGLDVAKRGGLHEPVIHKVTVGKNRLLQYDPEFVYANKGDIVLFEYFPMNHTVTQSSFDDPCTKQTNAAGVSTGLDSAFGFATKATDGKYQPTLAVTVNTEPHEPLWFYCRQTMPVVHCHKGMTFAINPPRTGNTFDKFKAKAIALGKDDKQVSAAVMAKE